MFENINVDNLISYLNAIGIYTKIYWYIYIFSSGRLKKKDSAQNNPTRVDTTIKKMNLNDDQS